MLGNTAFKGDTPSLSWFNALLEQILAKKFTVATGPAPWEFDENNGG